MSGSIRKRVKSWKVLPTFVRWSFSAAFYFSSMCRGTQIVYSQFQFLWSWTLLSAVLETLGTVRKYAQIRATMGTLPKTADAF